MRKLYTSFVVLLMFFSATSQTPETITKQGNYTVTGSDNLTATQSIRLLPNTWIKSGATFTARIVDAPEVTTANDAYTPFVFSNENYVFTRSYQTEMSSFNPNNAKEGDVIESITYFDGLGRGMQQIGIKSAPNKKDIIVHMEYDQYGRMEKEAAPGEDWRLGSGHEIEFEYGTNVVPGDIKKFHVFFTNGDTSKPNLGSADAPTSYSYFYNTNELYKTITKDENHDGSNSKLHTTEEFTNKQGQVILKRTYADINGDEKAHDTHYVYDDFGNLTYVLPPNGFYGHICIGNKVH